MDQSNVNQNGESSKGSEQRRVRFDDTNVKKSYANVCHVGSTKEEIILNFGLNQSWEHGQQDIQVQLTNRIILNPHAAKRLALLLAAVMQQYEARFGKLDMTERPITSGDSAVDPRPEVTGPRAVK